MNSRTSTGREIGASRPATLQRKLLTLAAASIIPLLLFTSAVVLWTLHQGRVAALEALDQTTQALALALDEQILVWQAALTALSTSSALDERRYDVFREQATAVTNQYGGWVAVSLPSGQQVVNTSRPSDSELPRSHSEGLPSSVTAEGRSDVSNLFWGPATQRLTLAVTVPAIRDGRTAHVLHLGLLPGEIADFLAQYDLPPGRSAMLVDSNQKIIAHTGGSPAGGEAPPWYAHASTVPENPFALSEAAEEGADLQAASQSLSRAPWTLLLTQQHRALATSWRLPLVVFASAGSLLIIGIVGAFIVIGRQLARPMNSLTTAARAAMQGASPEPVPPSRVRELNELGDVVMKLSEKQLLLREASHRIKNGLQLVSSSLALQAKASPHDAIKSEFRTAQSRIDAVARLHERLYQTEEYEQVDAFSLVREICTDVASLSADRVTFHVEIDGTAALSSANAGPFVLIVAELITNAVKHASEGGRVSVQCALKSGAFVLVRIANSGHGLAADFDVSRQTGLGLKMCNALARQIGGSLRTAPSSTEAIFELRTPALESGAPDAGNLHVRLRRGEGASLR